MENIPYPLIRRGLAEGKVIPFLGAGASIGQRNPLGEPWKRGANGLPLGSELGRYLAAEIGLTPAPPDLATVAQYYEYQAGRAVLDRTLDECLAGETAIPAFHRYLARLPQPLIVVTTNYDDLLERAFLEEKRPFDLIAYGNPSRTLSNSLLLWEHGKELRKVPANKLVLKFERTVIYKFHGFCSRQKPLESQYVITEDDYIDFLSRMVGTTAIPAALVEPFRSRAFLFVGYGLADWNLRLLLNRVSIGRTKQTKSWAIQYQVESFERPIWEQRNVNLYQLSLAAFLEGLEKA